MSAPDWLGESKHQSGLGRGYLSLNRAKCQQAVTTCSQTGIMHRSIRTSTEDYAVHRANRDGAPRSVDSAPGVAACREMVSISGDLGPPGRIPRHLGGDVAHPKPVGPAHHWLARLASLLTRQEQRGTGGEAIDPLSH